MSLRPKPRTAQFRQVVAFVQATCGLLANPCRKRVGFASRRHGALEDVGKRVCLYVGSGLRTNRGEARA
jgi:hypothetical protein